MSNKGKNHSKKWLISRLKTSGSKKRWAYSEDYADERNSKRRKDWENLPSIEGIGRAFQFYNGRINYGLLVRFLRGKVGGHWPDIYEEIMERIPTNLSQYKDCVDLFVAQEVVHTEDGLWDKGSQKLVLVPEEDMKFPFMAYNHKKFYVDPDTQRLCQVHISFNKHQTKDLDRDELRAFREEEQKEKQIAKACKKSSMTEEEFRDVLNQSQKKS